MLTQDTLKKHLYYDHVTGIFTRKIVTCNRIQVGDIAGSVDTRGYLSCSIDNQVCKMHRLVWLYVYGYFPEYGIDHINGVTTDNRLSNLRHVTPMCNSQNTKINSNNTSGFPGVSYRTDNNKYRSRVSYNGKSIDLGQYSTALEAALARLSFEICDPRWSCNYRSEIYTAIKKVWKGFKCNL